MIDLFVGFFVLVLGEIFSEKPNPRNCENYVIPFLFYEYLDKKGYLDNTNDDCYSGDSFYIFET